MARGNLTGRLVVAVVCASAAFVATPASAAAAENAYVANFDSGNVSAYSIAQGGALTPLGPTATGGTPLDVVISPDGAHLYVGNCSGGNICGYTIGAGGGLSPLSGSPFASPGGSSQLAVSPDGSHLYAVIGNNSIGAYAIAGDGGLTPVGGSPFPTGQQATQNLVITPDGAHLYAPNTDSNNVSGFTIAPGGGLSQIPGSPFGAGSYPQASTVTSDGNYLYIGNFVGQNVSGYKIAANGSLSYVPGQPFATDSTAGAAVSTPDGANVYAIDGGGTVNAFSVESGGFLLGVSGSPFPVGPAPNNGAVSSDGATLYVTNQTANQVSAFTIAPGGGLSALGGSPAPTGSAPFAIALTPAQSPMAALRFTGSKAGDATVLDASASKASDGRTIGRYSWNFGDGSVAAGGRAAPRHAYAPGEYTVTLTVADDAGCSTERIYTGKMVSCNGSPAAQISRQLTIDPAPQLRTKLAKVRINQRRRSATFRFSSGAANSRASVAKAGFECALVKRGKKGGRFTPCKSPKRYTRLKPGRYRFNVRAVSASDTDPTPATKRFRIKGGGRRG